MTRRSRNSPRVPVRRPHPSAPAARDLLEAEGALAVRVQERDRLADEARVLRRASQDAMRAIHAGERSRTDWHGLEKLARALVRSSAGQEGVAGDAVQEYAEARLLQAVVARRPLPSARVLGVPVEDYLTALGDLVGEVRRLAVSAMGREDLTEAVELLSLMDDLLHALLRFEAPRSLVQLKPKQDAARGMVERTRSELALAQVLRRAARAVGARRGEPLFSEGFKSVEGVG